MRSRALPCLREVWRGAHWRLYAVRGARPLASLPARMTHVGADGVTLAAPRPATVACACAGRPTGRSSAAAAASARDRRLDARARAPSRDARGSRIALRAAPDRATAARAARTLSRATGR